MSKGGLSSEVSRVPPVSMQAEKVEEEWDGGGGRAVRETEKDQGLLLEKGCRDGWTDRCTREQRTAADAPASRQLSPSVPPLDPSPPGSGASDNG